MADDVASPEELAKAFGGDLRFVAVTWNGDGEHGLTVEGNAHQYEAVGMLRAALRRLERVNADTVTLPAELESDDDFEDDEPEP